MKEYTFREAVQECLRMTSGNQVRHRVHVLWIQVDWARRSTRRKFSWCECCCEICNRKDWQ